jgi:hypothetical protein
MNEVAVHFAANQVVRLVVIVALIAGLLLATPFVAQVCFGPR